ncbi:MAG: phosphoglycerate mutase family protein [Bacteroidota bacterium]
MKHFLFPFLLGSCLLVFLHCGQAPQPAAHLQAFPPSAKEQLDSVLKAREIPGISIAWVDSSGSNTYVAGLTDPNKISPLLDLAGRVHGVDSPSADQPDERGLGLETEAFQTRFGKAIGYASPDTFLAYLPKQELTLAFQIHPNSAPSDSQPKVSPFTLADDILRVLLPLPKDSSAPFTDLYMVRHAEKVSGGTRDPALTATGRQRALVLAERLSDKGIQHIFSSPYQRTLQTAQPLADQLGLSVELYNPGELSSIFEIIAKADGQVALVVGHSNTIPFAINFLAGKHQLEQLADDAYEDLFHIQYRLGDCRWEQLTY